MYVTDLKEDHQMYTIEKEIRYVGFHRNSV